MSDLTGVWLGMKHTAPAMRGNGGGSIVNIGSIFGKAAAARRPLTTARKRGAYLDENRKSGADQCRRSATVVKVSSVPMSAP